MTYKVRLVCETETGDGEGFHYWYEDQSTIDETIDCGTHPSATTRDFAIVQTIP